MKEGRDRARGEEACEWRDKSGNGFLSVEWKKERVVGLAGEITVLARHVGRMR
jgi:hypothetical protein